MIAVDTSTLVHFTNGLTTPATDRLREALGDRSVLLPPVVLTEFLTGIDSTAQSRRIGDLPLIPLDGGYWRRAGQLRRRVLEQGRRAKLGDTLIAQSCLDAGLPLLASDGDFRIFAELADLRLVFPL